MTTIPKKDITPERALAEFKVACDIWMSYMDFDTVTKARNYCLSKQPKQPKSEGAS